MKDENKNDTEQKDRQQKIVFAERKHNRYITRIKICWEGETYKEFATNYLFS